MGKALPEPNTSLGWEMSLSCLGEHPVLGRKGMGEESMWCVPHSSNSPDGPRGAAQELGS